MTKTERWLIFGLLVALLVVVVFLAVRLFQISKSLQPSLQSGQEQITAELVFPASLFSSSITETQQVDAIITLPESAFAIASSKPDSSQYLTIILTGLFTLFGSGVVLVYNYLAGNSARKFEWGKHLWDKYQEDYLDLRNTVKETADAEMIENKLRALGSKVIMPPKLERELINLIASLRSEETTEKKDQERQAFLESFEGFITQPWNYL